MVAVGIVVLFVTASTLALSRPLTDAAQADLPPVLVLAAMLGLIGLVTAAAALARNG